jgi:hypothetical protein
MDEQDALFARRALGSLGGRRAASSSTKPSPRGEGGGAPPSAEKAQDYQPTPEEMIEIMKLLRDSGLSDAEPPPDVPETLEVRGVERRAVVLHRRPPPARLSLSNAPPPIHHH